MSDAATGPRPSPGKDYALVPHPDFPSSAVTAIWVEAQRDGGVLDLWFWLVGDVEKIRWPELCADCIRADGLWKETCFEAFVALANEPGYSELNFSPSGRWAAYVFAGYRCGMRHLENRDGTPFASHGYRGSNGGTYGMNFMAGDLTAQVDWHLNLTAVIEATDGTKSYWALAHAPGPPDFHNRDCFIATLPAPERP